MVTDNEMLIDKAKINYDSFLVPTGNIHAKKVVRKNTPWHKFDLDQKTSVNKIGEIVNLSQILNSALWEKKKSGDNYDEVYRDICQLAVLSGIEIDRSKKEFAINSVDELKFLREKYIDFVKQKPMFFYHLPNKQGYKRNKERYRDYDTTMDYLQQVVTEDLRKIRSEKLPILNLNEVLNLENLKELVRDSKEEKMVFRIFNDFNKLGEDRKAIWNNSSASKQEKYFSDLELMQNFNDELAKRKINIFILSHVLCKCKGSQQRRVLTKFFELFKNDIIELLCNQKNQRKFIIEDNEGDIDLYGKSFKNLQF